MRDAPESSLGVFDPDAAHQAMNLVAETEQMFGQITSVLARDPRDECFPGHLSISIFRHSRFLLNVRPSQSRDINNANLPQHQRGGTDFMFQLESLTRSLPLAVP